jgi:CHAD domain-containing protein
MEIGMSQGGAGPDGTGERRPQALRGAHPPGTPEGALDGADLPTGPGRAEAPPSGEARPRRGAGAPLQRTHDPAGAPAALQVTQTAGEAAIAILRRFYAAMLEHEAGTRRGRSPEALHQMRVATRRLRAALALCRDVLPARAARLRDELTWLAAHLGAVRDMDVQLAQVRSWVAEAGRWDRIALEPLLVPLRERRVGARHEMLQALDSPRYRRLLSAFQAFLDRGPLRRPAAARAPVAPVAADWILRRHRAARKVGEHITAKSPPARYHELRIKCKRLRYAVECFAELYEDAARPCAKRLAALQDLLGRHQDAYVAVARLRALRRIQARRLPPRTLFMMGQAAQRYAQQAAEARGAFPDAWQEVIGKRWKRLRHSLEATRPPDADGTP